MSSRAVRKLLELERLREAKAFEEESDDEEYEDEEDDDDNIESVDEDAVDGDEDEDEDEDDTIADVKPPQRNLFDLLGSLEVEEGDSGNDDEEEEADVTTPVEADNVESHTKSNTNSSKQNTGNRNKKNNTQQQKKKRGGGKKGKRRGGGKQADDIDALLAHIDGNQSGGTGNASTSNERMRRELEQRNPQKHALDLALLSVDSRLLDADAELKQMFGAATVDAATRGEREELQANIRQRQNRRGRRRGNAGAHSRAHSSRHVLQKPRPEWPRLTGTGVAMELKGTIPIEGLCFQFVWSKEYQSVQEQYEAFARSHDPNNLVSLCRVHPHHIGTNLQLAQLLRQTGEFEQAEDLIARCLYVFDAACHSMFAPARGDCRLSYDVPENKDFFNAVYRHVQLLSRKGCSRTALEFCKLLLQLDPSDPLCVLLCIDYYAMQSRSYEFLVSLASSSLTMFSPSSPHSSATLSSIELSDSFKERTALLPNFVFAYPLAKYLLQQQNEKKSASKRSTTSSSSSSTTSSSSSTTSSTTSGADVSDGARDTKSPDELLQEALMLFPMLLSPLAEKVDFTNVHPVSSVEVPSHLVVPATAIITTTTSTSSTSSSTPPFPTMKTVRVRSPLDVLRHPFFSPSNHHTPKSLDRLIQLFVERNFALWRESAAAQWICCMASVVCDRVDAGDALADSLRVVRDEEYAPGGEMEIAYRHVILSDLTDAVAIMPAELMQMGGGGIDGGGEFMMGGAQGGQFVAAPPPVVPADTDNAFALFLSTLLPWNDVPNAPYAEQPPGQ